MRYGYFRIDRDIFFNTSKDVFTGIKKKYDLDTLVIELDNEKEAFEKLMLMANKGDVIVLDDFASLGFNLRDFNVKLSRILTNGIGIVSILEKFDSNTDEGKNNLDFLNAVLQIEKSSKNKKGKVGRPSVPVDMSLFKELYPQWKNKKITAVAFMRNLGIKPNTFYRTLANYEANNGKKD